MYSWSSIVITVEYVHHTKYCLVPLLLQFKLWNRCIMFLCKNWINQCMHTLLCVATLRRLRNTVADVEKDWKKLYFYKQSRFLRTKSFFFLISICGFVTKNLHLNLRLFHTNLFLFLSDIVFFSFCVSGTRGDDETDRQSVRHYSRVAKQY